jgi:hypothetical protein
MHECETRYNFGNIYYLGETMIRFVLASMIVMVMLNGCTAKEFNDGVSDGIDDIKRVVRGTNN